MINIFKFFVLPKCFLYIFLFGSKSKFFPNIKTSWGKLLTEFPTGARQRWRWKWHFIISFRCRQHTGIHIVAKNWVIFLPPSHFNLSTRGLRLEHLTSVLAPPRHITQPIFSCQELGNNRWNYSGKFFLILNFPCVSISIRLWSPLHRATVGSCFTFSCFTLLLVCLHFESKVPFDLKIFLSISKQYKLLSPACRN